MVRRIALAMCCFLLAGSVCFAANPIEYVRRGSFGACPYRSVGDAVDSGFAHPQWTAGRADDGQVVVNVAGIVTWKGNSYRAVMQFGLKPHGFDVNGLSMNGKLMDNKFKTHFIDELCR